MMALGYSAAGTVVALGDETSDFHLGDRVACAGSGMRRTRKYFRCQKIFACVCLRIVSFDAGAFGTVGAIALQGVRLAELTLGESVVVIGLGIDRLNSLCSYSMLMAVAYSGSTWMQQKVELARESGR